MFSPQILSFMYSLDTPKIHGYRPHLGYRVFIDKALTNGVSARSPDRPAHRPPTPAEASPAPADGPPATGDGPAVSPTTDRPALDMLGQADREAVQN
jgi:hypothetical protein